MKPWIGAICVIVLALLAACREDEKTSKDIATLRQQLADERATQRDFIDRQQLLDDLKEESHRTQELLAKYQKLNAAAPVEAALPTDTVIHETIEPAAKEEAPATDSHVIVQPQTVYYYPAPEYVYVSYSPWYWPWVWRHHYYYHYYYAFDDYYWGAPYYYSAWWARNDYFGYPYGSYYAMNYPLGDAYGRDCWGDNCSGRTWDSQPEQFGPPGNGEQRVSPSRQTYYAPPAAGIRQYVAASPRAGGMAGGRAPQSPGAPAIALKNAPVGARPGMTNTVRTNAAQQRTYYPNNTPRYAPQPSPRASVAPPPSSRASMPPPYGRSNAAPAPRPVQPPPAAVPRGKKPTSTPAQP